MRAVSGAYILMVFCSSLFSFAFSRACAAKRIPCAKWAELTDCPPPILPCTTPYSILEYDITNVRIEEVNANKVLAETPANGARRSKWSRKRVSLMATPRKAAVPARLSARRRR